MGVGVWIGDSEVQVVEYVYIDWNVHLLGSLA